MEHGDIIPAILPEVPPLQLTIVYGDVAVDPGVELTPQQVQAEPQVSFDGDPEKFYTLLMTDPDAPSRKCAIVGDVNHWLVTNVPGGDFTAGEVLAGYRGAGPPRGSGLHRYIFLLFEQNGRIKFDEKPIGKDARMGRLRFNVKKFRNKYGFDNIVAWNYFKAQWTSPDAAEEGKTSKTCVCQ